MHEDLPFRRRITLRRRDATSVTAVIEDHIHHFEVDLRHRDGIVEAVDGRAVRAPWSACPDALGELQQIVGAPVGELWRAAHPDHFCTHQLDVAALAVRFAGENVPARRYEVVVRDWAAPVCRVEVEVDDGRTMRWEVQGSTILSPAPFSDRPLGAGFSSWAHRELPVEQRELALILRRATWMRSSRGYDLDEIDRLEQSGMPPSTCFASQPERLHLARRNRGSSLDELPSPPESRGSIPG